MGNARVKPLHPSEVNINRVPDRVIEAFNQLIKDKWDGNSANILITDAVAALNDKGFSKKEIDDKHYLDIEPIYRENGWNVHFDKPGYNESYIGYYVFKAAKNK